MFTCLNSILPQTFFPCDSSSFCASRQALRKLSRSGGRFKCPYCPVQVSLQGSLRLTFWWVMLQTPLPQQRTCTQTKRVFARCWDAHNDNMDPLWWQRIWRTIATVQQLGPRLGRPRLILFFPSDWRFPNNNWPKSVGSWASLFMMPCAVDMLGCLVECNPRS